MKAVFITFTHRGYELANKYSKCLLDEATDNTSVTVRHKCAQIKDYDGFIEESIGDYVESIWDEVDAIVYFCALGIVVRTISKCVSHKSTDPAVICMDESGKYCISVLSGHIGGANEIVRKLSALTGAIEVITTASDLRGEWAVDEFAAYNNLVITDFEMCKNISASILGHNCIGLHSDFRITGCPPQKIVFGENEIKTDYQINISIRNIDKKNTLNLIPKCLVIGIGCKKNTSAQKISDAITFCLTKEGIDIRSVCEIASIDIKRNEVGIIETAKNIGVPFVTYSADRLMEVDEKYITSSSEFVKSITGADNVCERSALIDSKELIMSRFVCGQVTVAFAKKDYEVSFNG